MNSLFTLFTRCPFQTMLLPGLLACGLSVTAQTVHISPTVRNGGFENGKANWTTVQEEAKPPYFNYWTIGSNAGTHSGNSALYVTDGSSGLPYGYETGDLIKGAEHSMSFIYQDITFPAGEEYAELSFYWMGQGEQNYDWMLVYIAPTTVTITPNMLQWSQTIPGATLIWSQPNATTTSFTKATVVIPPSLIDNATSPSTRRIMFVWQNDNNTGIQPPGAIDDVTLITRCRTQVSIESGGHCIGTPIQFTATADMNGGPSPLFEWEVDGVLQPVTGPNFTLASPWTDGTTVQAFMTSSATCAGPVKTASNTITVKGVSLVPATISISASPDSMVCQGQPIHFTSHFTLGGASPKYQWRVNGNDLPGETFATLTLDNLQDKDKVTVNFESSIYCALPIESDPIEAQITASDVPELDILGFMEPDGSYRFEVAPRNAGSNPYFQWQLNGQDIQGENQSSFRLPRMSSQDRVSAWVYSSLECSNPRVAKSNVLTREKVTGIPELDKLGGAELYPNPNHGLFSLQQLTAAQGTPIEWTVFSLVGQKLMQGTMIWNGQSAEINARDLAPGSYFLQIRHRDGQETLRFEKQ